MADLLKTTTNLTGPDSPHFSGKQAPEGSNGWEEVEPGRFMPQRVRGSFRGRALG